MTKKASTTEEPLKAVKVSRKASAKSVDKPSPESSTASKDQPVEAEAESELVVEKIENEPIDLNKESSSRFNNKSTMKFIAHIVTK